MREYGAHPTMQATPEGQVEEGRDSVEGKEEQEVGQEEQEEQQEETTNPSSTLTPTPTAVVVDTEPDMGTVAPGKHC